MHDTSADDRLSSFLGFGYGRFIAGEEIIRYRHTVTVQEQ